MPIPSEHKINLMQHNKQQMWDCPHRRYIPEICSIMQHGPKSSQHHNSTQQDRHGVLCVHAGQPLSGHATIGKDCQSSNVVWRKAHKPQDRDMQLNPADHN